MTLPYRTFGGRVSSLLDNIETTHAILFFFCESWKKFNFYLAIYFFYVIILVWDLFERIKKNPSPSAKGRKDLFMLQDDNITLDYKCQVEKIIQKAQVKKGYNRKVISFLEGRGELTRADKIRDCASMLGFTNIENIAHIVKANFCRDRLCSVCAWRRQARFVSQMRPVMQNLENEYKFVFVTLTVKSVSRDMLKGMVDLILKAYDRLLKLKQISSSWVGKIRALELTYNEEDDLFHPHLHILVAVKPSYFESSQEYISHEKLCFMWQNCLRVDYIPVCDIRSVNDNMAGAVETLKYGLKPAKGMKPLEAFADVLRGRRLVSFSGVFADMRKKLKLSSFEDVLVDDIPVKSSRYECVLYKFDTTGGVYKYYEKLYYERE